MTPAMVETATPVQSKLLSRTNTTDTAAAPRDEEGPSADLLNARQLASLGAKRAPLISTASYVSSIIISNGPAENTPLNPDTPCFSTTPPTPIPWRPVLVLLMLTAVQPLAFELVFPFVNQMILELGIVDNPEGVGFYSGLIESIFAVMALVTIFPCCYISDHYGRKPVILFGIGGLAISTALFGLSTNFAMMVVTRCFGGALGGVWPTMKVVIAEITDNSNQASVMSWSTISYRVGQTIGQPIGGLLSHPERNFTLFQGKFWHAYPFSLPCFVAAAFAFLSVVLGYWNMEETLKPRGDRGSDEEGTGQNLNADTASINPIDYGTFKRTSNNTDDQLKVASSKSTYGSLLTPHVVSLLLSTTGLVIASEALFSLYPLFAFTPVESGGLGLNEAAIGTHMAVRAINSMLIMFCYAPMQRRLGTLRLYRLSMCFWPPCFLLLPVLNVLARRTEGATGGWLFWSALWTYFTIWSFATSSWSGSSIMIIDAAPSQESLSALNGMNQIAISLPQAIAPALTTSMFAYSIRTGIAGGKLTSIIFGVGTIFAAVHSYSLKQSTHDWRMK